MAERPTQTTAAGIPVGDNHNSLTAGPRGPLLVQDWQLFEKHAPFYQDWGADASAGAPAGTVRYHDGAAGGARFCRSSRAEGDVRQAAAITQIE